MTKADLKFADVKPYDKNAKEHTDKQLLQLAEIVKEVGWRQPSIVNQKGIIIVGHGRYLSFKKFGEKLGLKPIWIMDDMGRTVYGEPETSPMTARQESIYRLADNKLNESKWEMELVVEELKLMNLPDIKLTGFNANIILETKEDTPNLSAITTPKSKLGDLYELGPHRLICGDSTNPETYKKLLGTERPRLVFTDPPYSIDYLSGGGLSYNSDKFGGTGGKIFNDDKTPAEALEFYKKISKQIYDFTSEDMTLYWWYANRLTDINMDALRQSKFHFSQIVLWLKNSLIFSPGQLYHRIYEPCMVLWKEGKVKYQDLTFSAFTELWELDKKTFAEHLDIWYQKRDNTSKYIHPTQRPVQLAERAIKRSSAKGDQVLDAFGGSGSTLIACDQLERSARLIELDPKYVDAIVTRWIQFSETTHIIKNGESIPW